jgi:sporulation integral membrane protein YlbJ
MKILAVHKNKLIKGAILLFLIAMMLYPGASFQGASTGLLLWFHNVLPNLLPFIIVSNLMVHLNITRQISKVFHPVLGRLFHVSCDGCYPIAIGFLSGIPMGAKTSTDLVSERIISRSEGQFLLNMCNNASPMFIMGYIAITQLKLPHIKYALFVIIYGSAILSALTIRYLTRLWKKEAALELSDIVTVTEQKRATSSRFSFALLDSSIMNGFEIVTKIGGYIILFSILAQIINEVGPDISFYKAFLMGIFEITTGISQICKAEIDLNTKIVLVAVLTSFGGFSGMAQTKSVLGDSRLSMKSYFIVKLLSVGISLLFALLYVAVFRVN